jgi:mycothiol maleylpyruvate isomerase-like protein
MTASPESPAHPLETFRTSVREFVECVEALPETLWLTKIVNWTPRDVVAHLIGWNVYVHEGCDLLRAGKTPAYLNDREHDYRHVNAASVERFASRDRRTLLGELDASFQALERYLAELDAATWDADTGVRVNGRPVTIRNSVRAFARDYDSHRRRLEQWQAEIGKR